MDTLTHKYLTKLRIISKIPENGRIDITRNDLNIYNDNVLGWVLRKIHGDNKENAAKYLMDLYREISSFSDQYMYNITNETDACVKLKKIIILISFTEKLKDSLSGIRNLIGTYKQYIKIVSILECVEQDIIIPLFNTLVNFIPEDQHTDSIKIDPVLLKIPITRYI